MTEEVIESPVEQKVERSSKKVFLLLFLFSFFAAIPSFYGYRYFTTTSLISQAVKQKNNEHLETSLELLKKAENRAFTKEQKLLIETTSVEIEALLLHKAYYEAGVVFSENGSWEKALLEWEKIPKDSIYTKKYKTTVTVPHKKPDGNEVLLVNYTHANDPTWNKLLNFLKKDNTDELAYDLDTFVCTGFAETLHNSAEKLGIKAAYVGIRFIKWPGHAVTAFNTLDKGLIYIDNTGSGNTDLRDTFLEENRCEWDKVAYIEENKDYGSISINYSDVEPTKYDSYIEYTGLWTDVELEYKNMSLDIDQYNNQQVDYENALLVYEIDSQAYKTSVEDYDDKIKQTQVSVKQSNQEKIEKFKDKTQGWELKKANYETKLTAYNKKVKLFNDENVGDYDALIEEEKQLKNEYEALNIEFDALKEEEIKINSEIEEKTKALTKNFKSEKEDLDELKKELNNIHTELTTLAQKLTEMSESFKLQLQALKNREEYLGICYWKSLGYTTKIETYW